MEVEMCHGRSINHQLSQSTSCLSLLLHANCSISFCPMHRHHRHSNQKGGVDPSLDQVQDGSKKIQSPKSLVVPMLFLILLPHALGPAAFCCCTKTMFENV